MPLPLIGVAAKVLAGPVGSVLGSVFSGVAGSGGLGQVAGTLLSGPEKLFKGIGKAFGKLFGRKRKKPQMRCPARPQPFRPPLARLHEQFKGINDQLGKLGEKLGKLLEGLNQPAGNKFDNLGIQDLMSTVNQSEELAQGTGVPANPMTAGLQQALQALPDLLGKLTGTQWGDPHVGAGQSPGGAVGFDPQPDPPVPGDSVAAAGNRIDGMMKQAEQLMMSDNKADQLKGQKMMQDAQNMFQMMSNLLKAQADMQKAVIQNMRV
jgi:hypothetical protein